MPNEGKGIAIYCLIEDNESLEQPLNSLMSATIMKIVKQTYHRTGPLSDSGCYPGESVCAVSQSYRPRGQICGRLTCFRCDIYSSDQAKGLLALAVGCLSRLSGVTCPLCLRPCCLDTHLLSANLGQLRADLTAYFSQSATGTSSTFI